MFLFTAFSLFVFVSAAPHYRHGPSYSEEFDSLEKVFEDEMFSMRNFWKSLRRDMMNLEEDLNRRLSLSIPVEKIEDDKYIITMPLADFDEKDVSVKIGRGMLQVDAHNTNNGANKHYVYLKTLPENVQETGTWELENNVLTVTLPLKGDTVPKTDEIENKSVEREHSREEIEDDKTSDSMNADVGLETTVQPELLTNKIPKSKVEATTYSEFNNDIDFVPVRY